MVQNEALFSDRKTDATGLVKHGNRLSLRPATSDDVPGIVAFDSSYQRGSSRYQRG